MSSVADTTCFWLVRYSKMGNTCKFVLYITNVKLFLIVVHTVGFNLKALNYIFYLVLHHVAMLEEK